MVLSVVMSSLLCLLKVQTLFAEEKELEREFGVVDVDEFLFFINDD